MIHLIGDLHVSRETFEKLKAYESLLSKWTKTINLISSHSEKDIWARHILDSAQLFDHWPKTCQRYTDLGSGGGLPAIVLIILLDGIGASTEAMMIESDQRKGSFLRTALRELELTASIVTKRISDVPPSNANVLTARALAPLQDLLSSAVAHLAPGGIALLQKGRNYEIEIDAAHRHWQFTATTKQSLTAPDSRILLVKDIQRANP